MKGHICYPKNSKQPNTGNNTQDGANVHNNGDIEWRDWIVSCGPQTSIRSQRESWARLIEAVEVEGGGEVVVGEGGGGSQPKSIQPNWFASLGRWFTRASASTEHK